MTTDIQDYHEPTREELAALNNLTPLVQPGEKVEPMMLIDVSGSEAEAASPTSDRPTKISVILEALPAIVETLESEDSEAADKAAAGEPEEDEGGVYTICFSDEVFDLEDLNSNNIADKKAEIRSIVGGGTVITPGWNALVEHYEAEFGDRDEAQRPILAGLVITDGAADDADKFADVLRRAEGKQYVVVAVIGFGKRHDATVAQYTEIAKSNNHVRVLTFGAVTNPLVIARSMLALIGK